MYNLIIQCKKCNKTESLNNLGFSESGITYKLDDVLKDIGFKSYNNKYYCNECYLIKREETYLEKSNPVKPILANNVILKSWNR